MDRNSVIGLLLIAVILVVFSVMSAPSEEEQKKMAAQRDSLARVEAAKTKEAIKVEGDTTKKIAVIKAADDTSATMIELASDSASVVNAAYNDSINKIKEDQKLIGSYGLFASAAKGDTAEKIYTIENEKIRAKFSAKGGRLLTVELKNYETYSDYAAGGEKQALLLFDEDSTSMGLSFFVNDLRINSNELFATTTAPSKQEAKGTDSVGIAFRMNTDDPKKYLEIVYSLKGDSYVMGMQVNVVGLEKENTASSLELNWTSKLLATEKLVDSERMISSVFYKYTDESRSYLSEASSDKLMLAKKTSWVAFKSSYFSAVIMSDKGLPYEGSEIAINTITSDKYIKEYIANLNISEANGASVKVPLKFYFGPNDYEELAKMENGMEGIVNLGWGIFGWVNKWLVIPIFNFLESFGMHYALIILLLTIVVKILIMPLTYKNYLSSAKMRVLKPEVDEIGKKYGPEDAMKKQQEVMALYRKSGVNPLAGCIPLLIQMPVLIAVFRFFPSAIQLRQQSFFWADDLSGYDSVLDLSFSIPFYGDHVSLFTLLMCVSTILITRMNSGQMDNSMPGMKFMMYFFPIMMLFFFNNFAAGLTYYYFISNILSLVIMWGIKKFFIDEQKILATIHENRKKPQSPKKSAFMQRLEEAAKQKQQQKKKK